MTQTLFGVSHYVGQTLNLEANREVNEVKVQVVQLEGSQRLVQAHRDVFWGVKGTPQLADTNRKHNRQFYTLFPMKMKNKKGGTTGNPRCDCSPLTLLTMNMSSRLMIPCCILACTAFPTSSSLL